MGGFLSTFQTLLFAKKEIRILILGLDNAGKTTLLYRLKIGEVVTTIPTIGFNVESVTYKNLNFSVWDLGGQTSIRPYWRCYYANTAAVVFVIDSTDVERLETAAEELQGMLAEEELRDAALLVFANKQDQPGAKGAGEISEALKLGGLKDRNWSIMACSAIDGRGVNEGMDWLVLADPAAAYKVQLADRLHKKACERIRHWIEIHLRFADKGIAGGADGSVTSDSSPRRPNTTPTKEFFKKDDALHVQLKDGVEDQAIGEIDSGDYFGPSYSH